MVSPLKIFDDFVLSKFVFKGGGKGDGEAPAPAKVLFLLQKSLLLLPKFLPSSAEVLFLLRISFAATS